MYNELWPFKVKFQNDSRSDININDKDSFSVDKRDKNIIIQEMFINSVIILCILERSTHYNYYISI